MNDTVYAQIQLNGNDNVQYTGWKSTKEITGIDIREPYLERNGSYLYMYVGVDAGKAVDLRVKEADTALCANSVRAVGHDGEISIAADGDASPLVYRLMMTDAQRRVIMTASGISADASKGQYPTLSGFNIQLSNCSLTGGQVQSTSLLGVNRLTLSDGGTLTSRGFGTSLPTTALYGEVFFLISAE